MAVKIFIAENNLGTFKVESERALERALEVIGIQAEKNAKYEVDRAVYDQPESPYYVRTGRLRNSITHEVETSEKAVYVGSNVEYAPYVELGTYRMAPRPFIEPAIENYSEDYKKILQAILEGTE